MRKWIIVGVVVAVVAVGGIVVASAQSGGSDEKPVLITDTAVVRDLRDEVTVSGTLERAEQRTVNWFGGGGGSATAAASASVVSAVYLDNGAPLNPGDAILAVDGRKSIASPGLFPFFRKLDVGAEGSDVLQLKTILAAAGFQPGPADTRFTEQTRFALGQWQASKGYPGASPSTSQSVNVSLQQGAGYQLGAQTSAGLTIGPPPARKAAARRDPGVGASAVEPVITIGTTSTTVKRGTVATFTVQSDIKEHDPITVHLSIGGTIATTDLVPSATTAELDLADGVTSASLSITVLANATAPDQTLSVTVQDGDYYSVGSPSSATVDVPSSVVPEITVSGTTNIDPGETAIVTITASQAPVADLQVNLSVTGSAQADVDYVPVPPNPIIPRGQTSTTVAVQAKTTSTIKPNRFVLVAAAQGVGYTVGSPSSATVTILGESGYIVPEATITVGNLRVNGGTPAQFTVGLDRPQSQALELSLSYGGDAVMGSDYNPAGGVVTVPPNQTSVAVSVPTLNNGLVQPDKTLVVSLVPQSTYTVGNPGSAETLILAPTQPKVSIYGGPAAVSLGGGVVFTVVADQPPIKDTSVQYTVTGSAQQGKDIQPVTGSVVIPAGATTATINILTLNTNVFFLPTDIIVTTSGGRLGQLLVEEGDVVPAGTPLFTLTEANVAVTLDASAGDRTKLKVGQTVTVQVQGGTASAPGIITELDDFPTTDPQTKQQTFKGKVQVQGDLGAADGTPVTVNVVVQERKGALTVPIAAVKQNGSGVDVVRIIALDTGKTRDVEVETGLSEGSYIEIKRGLAVDDVVVVELDKQG